MMIRNIFNGEELDSFLNKIIRHKQLDSNEGIKKWLLSNCKNHLFKSVPVQEVAWEDLSRPMKKIVDDKGIQPPYHHLVLNAELESKVLHIVDYYTSAQNTHQDWSRISYRDAQKKANAWITELNAKASDVEDFANLRKVYSFTQDGQEYTWVNMRSLKCLQREGKLMSNCVTSYWKEGMVEGKVSDFYSLRDKDNNPLITLNIEVECFSRNPSASFFNNPEIEHKFTLVDPAKCELDESDIKLLNERTEQISRSNVAYVCIMAEYHHPNCPDLVTIRIIEAKEKYNEPVDLENTKLITQFLNNHFIQNIDKVVFGVRNEDSSLLIASNHKGFISFSDDMLTEERRHETYCPRASYEELGKNFPINNVLMKCFFNEVCFNHEVVGHEVNSNYFTGIGLKSTLDNTINLEQAVATSLVNCEGVCLQIAPKRGEVNYSYSLDHTVGSKVSIHLPYYETKGIHEIENHLCILSNSVDNQVKFEKQMKSTKSNEIKKDTFFYVIDENSNSIENITPSPVFKMVLKKDTVYIEKIKPGVVSDEFSSEMDLSDTEHFNKITALIVGSLYSNQDCIEKELLQALKVDFSQGKALIGNCEYSMHDFFQYLLNKPCALISEVLKVNNLEQAFNLDNGLLGKLIYFVNKGNKYDIVLDNGQIKQYMQNINDVFLKNNCIFAQELRNEDDNALLNYLNNLYDDCEKNKLPMSLYVVEKMHDNILQVCRQVNSTTSNALTSKAQNKIRQGRKNNIVRYLSLRCGFSNNELNSIFEQTPDYTPTARPKLA